MKLKDKLIYIISSICAIYISYLFCRLYNFNVYGNICVGIINLIISLYLSYIWKKNTNNKELSKKLQFIIIIISIVFSIVTIMLNWNSIRYKFKTTSVEIYSNQIELHNVIDEIAVNNVYYNIGYDNEISNQNQTFLEEKEIGIKISNINEDRVKIDFNKYKDIKIVFNDALSKIDIKDGENELSLNLDQNYIYTVKSNMIEDSLFIIRILLLLCVITYITMLTIEYIYKNNKKRYFVITIILTFCIGYLHYKYCRLGTVYPDSYSYINFDFANFLNGIFSDRTPVYPFIIKICKELCSNGYLQLVCQVQYAIWFIAIVFLYKLLKLVVKNEKLVSTFTLIYALCPAVIGWNNNILTESIALSVTIIFIYNVIKYIKIASLKNGIASIIIAFLLTFHRPTSIIYVVFLEIFWIGRFIFERENIKNDFKCFIVSTITIGLIIVYAIIFNKTFGYYSITDAMPRQMVYVCMQEQYYKNSNDENFKRIAEEGAEQYPDDYWGQTVYILSKYEGKEAKKLASECRNNSKSEYIRYLYNLTVNHTSVYFEAYNFKFEYCIWTLIMYLSTAICSFMTFSHTYIVIAIEGILIVYKWIKYKKVPWIHCGLCGFPLVIVFSSFLGTCGEFMRTAICAVPFTYISIVTYIDMISKNKEEKNDDIIIEENLKKPLA